MADPLAVAASVVGITVPALHGTRLLLDDLYRIKDAPEAVKSLKEDILSVDLALNSLQAVEDREWESLGGTIADESKAAITSCIRACAAFRTDLRRWTRHSADGKLSWQDRANVGFFKQRRIKSVSEQLQSCKITLNAVVSIATLCIVPACRGSTDDWPHRYSSIRHTHISEEIKKTISTKQTEISSAIGATNKQLADIRKRLEELHVAGDSQEEAESTQCRAEAVRQIEEERNAISTSRKLLDELLAKAQKEAIVKAATKNLTQSVTFGSNNSGIQIGVSNGPISGISFGGKRA
jgi:hypothetical protein